MTSCLASFGLNVLARRPPMSASFLLEVMALTHVCIAEFDILDFDIIPDCIWIMKFLITKNWQADSSVT